MLTPEYSFIIPVYNESANLPTLYARLNAVTRQLDGPSEIIFIDDGSRDDSVEILIDLESDDSRIRILRFARNFGHQLAITAGMDHARGNAIVIMDADLQDPPELVIQMSKLWRDGFDIVYAQRAERKGETWAKKALARAFYRVQRKLASVDMPENTGDFRLADRRVIEAFRGMRESNRYVRGMFAWLGFRQTAVPFSREPRFAGRPQYTFIKSLWLALDAMFSFSYAPLRVGLALGILTSIFALCVGLWAVVEAFAGHVVPGWASTVSLISFLGGIQLIVLGIMGEYIGRIYEEAKGRPLYVLLDSATDRRSNSPANRLQKSREVQNVAPN